MISRFILSLALTFSLVSVIPHVEAAEWYVDAAVETPGDGTGWDTAFRRIQDGVDAAADGDIVIVAPRTKGDYFENIHFEGKNIVLRSTDPMDPDVVASTVINGGRAGPVVTFAGSEDARCLLSGFTIQGGEAADRDGGGVCGGTPGRRTRATIANNVIKGNAANWGGGIAFCDGLIKHNTVTGNSCLYSGAGLVFCDGLVEHNTISGNPATEWGGGLAHCDGTIQGNTISSNSAYGGGGLAMCNGIVANNVISGNETTGGYNGWGGGVLFCDGVMRNNTIVANSSLWPGGGVAFCGARIVNCIIWGNSGSADDQVHNSPFLEYSCVQDWADGNGNMAQDPEFADPDGPDDDANTYEDNDYHLSVTSPCIDLGLNEDWMWQADDRDGNPRVLPVTSEVRVDIGAYEFVPASPVGDTWYVDSSASESGDGRRWDTAFQSIQQGIDAASDGDSVLVAEGIYHETIQLGGKNILLRSSDLFGNLAISTTIIDGGQSGSVVTFSGSENETCVLSGFTIRNGSASYGGGVLGGLGKNRTHARIEHNVIAGNAASENGGGLAYCAGPIINNTVCRNDVATGAGLYSCSGPIRNCIVWGNGGGPQLSGSKTPAYSCIEALTGGGEGNRTRHPYFSDVDSGDYHLQGSSPCIDAGDPGALFSEEASSIGARINMGAYGNTPGAAAKSSDTDGDGLPDDWETEHLHGVHWGAEDNPDGDNLSNLQEYHGGTDPLASRSAIPLANWHVDATIGSSGDGTSQEAAFLTIQEGIDAASEGDTVVVAEGTYLENIRINGNNITLRSVEPLDEQVVAETIIDGNQSGSAVTYCGTEDETCILSGFTIRNGRAFFGGGIAGHGTHATIQHCRVVNNDGDTTHGGGLHGCDGLIQNNTIARNTSAQFGGGLAFCDGIVQNNAILDNSTAIGGGLICCSGVVRNSTIVGNSGPSHGGGVGASEAAILNCIIWGNSSGHDTQIHKSRTPAYSCIQGWSGGEGNISLDPRLVASSHRLDGNSPCIDAGMTEEWMQQAVDLDGNPRLWGDAVDIGAHEYGSFPFRIERVLVSDGAELTWISRPGDTYIIRSCADCSDGQWDLEKAIASQGETTTWTDSDTTSKRKFYRIEIQ